MTYHKKYNSFYSGKQWRALRDYVRLRDMVCCRCTERGLVVQGIEVHHKIPIDKDWELRYDVDNLELLCKDCHDLQHDRVSALQKFMNERQ